MRTRNFLNNTLAAALLQIVQFISGMIIPRIILVSYGSEINGLVTSINQFLSYFNLIEAGLANAAIYSLYKPLAEKNYNSINSILTATKKFYYKIGFLYFLLVSTLAFTYPILVESQVLTSIEIGLLAFVLGCSGVINFALMAKYRVLLTASQKVYVISFANIAYIVLNTLFIGVLARFNVNIILLKTITLSSVLLRSLILHVYVKRVFRYVRYDGVPNYQALNKRWDALYQQILGSIQNGWPVIAATLFTSLKSVSVFSIYNMVFNGVIGILSIFKSGLASSFGDVIAKNEQKVLQKSYQEFEFSYYMIISWAYSCSLILILPFIKVYTYDITDAQYINPLLAFLFVLNGLLYNIKTPQGMLIISAGMFRETRIQVTIQGLILIVASSIFAYFFGLEGVIVGTCLSNLYRTIDMLFFVPKYITRTPVLTSFKRMLRVFFVVFVSYIPFFSIKLNPTSLQGLIGIAIIIAIYCFAVTLAINLIIEKIMMKRICSRIFYVLKRLI